MENNASWQNEMAVPEMNVALNYLTVIVSRSVLSNTATSHIGLFTFKFMLYYINKTNKKISSLVALTTFQVFSSL